MAHRVHLWQVLIITHPGVGRSPIHHWFSLRKYRLVPAACEKIASSSQSETVRRNSLKSENGLYDDVSASHAYA